MDEQRDMLLLEPGERDGMKVTVRASYRNAPVHSDMLNPASSTSRKRFIKDLRKKVDALTEADEPAIDAELLRIADTINARPDPAMAGGTAELDIAGIVRPEQFFKPNVAGLTVPVVKMVSGKPAARWMLCLRRPDGRREMRDLPDSIDLDGGSRLWIHPTPGEPAMNTAPGWAAPARQAWLGGADAPDPADLFKRLCERIAFFIDLPPDVAAGTTATLALWVLLSYVYQAWDAVPYLFVGGPLGSGKSRVFEILSRLVFRPLLSSNVTAPALFRTLHDRGGAVLFDEAERLRQSTPEVEGILSMLLAGYKRGGQATRLEAVGDNFKTVAFEVYGPKALACIAGLPPALASRCISLTMFRAGPGSPKPRRRIDADAQGWQALRNDLYAVALENGPTWPALATRANVCPVGIDGRSYELWQPLLALAGWVESHGANGLLAMMQRYALATIDAGKDEQVSEADETLLEILTDAVRASEWLTPGDILSKAQERDPNTFGKPNGPGPRWHPNTVSRHLKNYGIAPPKKSNGKRYYRNIELDQLRRIQLNYGIDLQIEEVAPVSEQSTLTDPSDPVSVSTDGESD